MAKPDPYAQFLAEVLSAVPEDKRATIEGTLNDASVAPVVRERVLARADYSRQSDALKQARAQLESEVTEARKRIDGWTNWYENANKEYDTATKKLQRYQQEFGDLEGDGVQPKKDFLSKEDFTRELQARDRDAITFADVLTDLKIEHRQHFGEKLNTNELLKYATDRGLPIDIAYQQMVAPKIEERRSTEIEEKIAKAREEGAQEALSRHKLPGVVSYNEPHPIDRTDTTPVSKEDRIAAAVASWNKAGSHSIT